MSDESTEGREPSSEAPPAGLEAVMAAANAAIASDAFRIESQEYVNVALMATRAAREAWHMTWIPLSGTPPMPEAAQGLVIQMAWQSAWQEAMHRRRHGQGDG